MKDSTIRNKAMYIKVASILVWIGIWQLGSSYLANELLFPSPTSVFYALMELIKSKIFYQSLINTFLKIFIGFFLGNLIGIILSILSYKYEIIRILLWPLISFVKSVPVASIIIITLVWISSKDLNIFISFLMVLPTIYISCLNGLDNADVKMLEMAKVFKLSYTNKIRYIYIPEVKPYFMAAISIAFGLAWKSGVAAEVIGLPRHTIGEALYNAKLYLNISELFAWTIVLVVLSIILETLMVKLLDR